jgi:hypothetical protein
MPVRFPAHRPNNANRRVNWIGYAPNLPPRLRNQSIVRRRRVFARLRCCEPGQAVDDERRHMSHPNTTKTISATAISMRTAF